MKNNQKQLLLAFLSIFTLYLNVNCISGSIGNPHLKKMYIFVKNETPYKLTVEAAFKGGIYKPLISTPLTGKDTENWKLKMTGWGVVKYVNPNSPNYFRVSEINVHEKKTLYKSLINKEPVGTGKYNAENAKTLIQFKLSGDEAEELQGYKIGVETILNPEQKSLVNRVTGQEVNPPEIPVRKRFFGLGKRIYANVQASYAAKVFLIKDGKVVEEKIFTEKSKHTFDLKKHGGPFKKVIVERIYPRNKKDLSFKSKVMHPDAYDSIFVDIQSNEEVKSKL